MNKKSVLFYLLTSLLSLIFIGLSYYGITRYLKLKVMKPENYVKSYIKLPRVQTKNKVIVSLSTREKEFEKIKLTINSLLDQTVHADQIIISTPPNIDIDISDDIRKKHLIIVHKLATDYGKCSNLISPLLREKDGDTMIILVNDKTIYGEDFIESLVEESESYPNSIIYISGYNAAKYLKDNKLVNKENENDVINVKCGVLIKPKFFTGDILDVFNTTPKNLEDSENVCLSMLVHKDKLNVKQLKYGENFCKGEQDDKNLLLFYSYLFPSIK